MRVIRIIWFALALILTGNPASSETPAVTPGYRIEFPRDAGSHPQFRTEWWYVTGWLQDAEGVHHGFQVTFFRSRNQAAEINPSNFAPDQLIFAHAALSDPRVGRLHHAQRSARAGFGLAGAAQNDTNVYIDDWYLRARNGHFTTQIRADDFALDLVLEQTQAPLLQGVAGFSRKGPSPTSASYYYSLPQLQVRGTRTSGGRKIAVSGRAWFDHEWSSEYLAPQAQGWDWIGINLVDGAALMAFRIRDAQGGQYWAAATMRTAKGLRMFEAAEIKWTPIRKWQSPTTGVHYPVEWRIKLGDVELRIVPLMDNQESDSRGSVGVLYWEGAVETLDASGKVIGRGYLELTGYDRKLPI